MIDDDRVNSMSHEYQEYYLDKQLATLRLILFYQRIIAVILVLFWVFYSIQGELT
jgi:hypothetical protein